MRQLISNMFELNGSYFKLRLRGLPFTCVSCVQGLIVIYLQTHREPFKILKGVYDFLTILLSLT